MLTTLLVGSVSGCAFECAHEPTELVGEDAQQLAAEPNEDPLGEEGDSDEQMPPGGSFLTLLGDDACSRIQNEDVCVQSTTCCWEAYQEKPCYSCDDPAGEF